VATVAADAIGDLVEHADHRPAMPAAPLILAVASQRVVNWPEFRVGLAVEAAIQHALVWPSLTVNGTS
jgi:hypothetical protein